MSRSSTLLRNISYSWVGFSVNAVVTLVLTPYILQGLGEARYGVWILSSSIIGYYGLLDLGFRGSINQFLTRYLALRDYEKASECMSTAMVVLASSGAFFSVLSLIAAYVSPYVFNFPPGMEREAFWSILLVGMTSSLQFAFFPFMAVFTATQRFDLANLIGVGTRVLTAIFVIAALKMGYGLVGISAATCAISLVDYIIRWRVALRLAPDLEVSHRLANRARFREMVSFGFWTFLISVNAFVYLHAQTLLIAALLPIAVVGYFALATTLSRQVNDVLNPIGQVFYPAATGLYAQGDGEGLDRLYHDGSRLILLVTICVVLGAAFWADDFYRLWIGDKYVSGKELPSLSLLLQVLLISTVSSSFSNIAGQILIGAGRVRVVAALLIVGSVINLTLSVALLKPFGLIGLVAATAIASVIVDLVAKPIVLQRTLGMPFVKFVRVACPRPIVVGLLLALLMWSIKFLAGAAESWPQLVYQGIGAVVCSTLVVFSVGVTGDERRRFIVNPILRLLKRRKSIVLTTGR